MVISESHQVQDLNSLKNHLVRQGQEENKEEMIQAEQKVQTLATGHLSEINLDISPGRKAEELFQSQEKKVAGLHTNQGKKERDHSSHQEKDRGHIQNPGRMEVELLTNQEMKVPGRKGLEVKGQDLLLNHERMADLHSSLGRMEKGEKKDIILKTTIQRG